MEFIQFYGTVKELELDDVSRIEEYVEFIKPVE